MEFEWPYETQRPVLVIVKNNAPVSSLDEEDQEVPGIYLVGVQTSLSDDIAASVALDTFHGRVAIGALDDFTISTYDPRTKKAINEAEDAEPYDYVDEGDLIGKISDDPCAMDPKPARNRRPR